MKNIVDLIQLRISSAISREIVEEVMTAAIESTIAHLDQGNDVYWPKFAKFIAKTVKSRKKETKGAEELSVQIIPDSSKIKATSLQRLKKTKPSTES